MSREEFKEYVRLSGYMPHPITGVHSDNPHMKLVLAEYDRLKAENAEKDATIKELREQYLDYLDLIEWCYAEFGDWARPPISKGEAQKILDDWIEYNNYETERNTRD